MNGYTIPRELSIPAEADQRKADLTLSEVKRGGYRRIGGDKGDIRFNGYTVEEGKTILAAPVLVTCFEGLTSDEVQEIAETVLLESYESIGVETVEHS